MSRTKKSRSLKDRLNVKTGSKKDFIDRSENGKIPSHNRLAKHKNRPKSAYQRHIEANQLKDTSAGNGPKVPPRAEPEVEYEAAAVPLVDEKGADARGFDELSGDELLDKFARS